MWIYIQQGIQKYVAGKVWTMLPTREYWNYLERTNCDSTLGMLYHMGIMNLAICMHLGGMSYF